MEIKDKTIALLIDSDNISREYYSILLDELSKYGRVTYRRLYGDFSKPKSNGWKEALLEYSIEQVQQIAYTTGKNASDLSMVIDAMDILFKGKVDCFCLATSDSDFTGLAMRFRNDNIIVIGAGEEKTPNSFRKACDRFISIDELLKAKMDSENLDQKAITTEDERTSEANELTENIKVAEPIEIVEKKSTKVVKKDEKIKTDKMANKSNKKIQEKSSIKLLQDESDKDKVAKHQKLIEMAKMIISDEAEADGWMHFSAFMNEVYRKENDFNPKLYGHSNSNAAPFFKSLKDEKNNYIFTLEKTGNIDRIKINK